MGTRTLVATPDPEEPRPVQTLWVNGNLYTGAYLTLSPDGVVAVSANANAAGFSNVPQVVTVTWART